jgi:hypothetical protein
VKKFAALFCAIPFLLVSHSSPAAAVYGGEEALGDERVVAMLMGKYDRSSVCSATLISDRIVLTAAHCLGKLGVFPGELRANHWEFWVTQPGVDVSSDDVDTRVQSAYVAIVDDYTNIWNLETNDKRTTVNDIGFIFLKDPIHISKYPRIATAAEVEMLKSLRAEITHYGYGRSDKDVTTGRPKKVKLKIRPRERWYEANHPVPEERSIITDETGVDALCAGDSGGPWFAELEGELLIVANLVGASGCNGPGSGAGGTFGTLVHPLETFLWEKWEYFQQNETEILGWNPDYVPYVPKVCIEWEGEKAECVEGRMLLNGFFFERAELDWTEEFCYSDRLVLLKNTGTKWTKIGALQGKKGVKGCRGKYPFFTRLSSGKLGISNAVGEHQFAIRPLNEKQRRYWEKFTVIYS